MDLSYNPQTDMGRKLNVALLLAMHLGFFACAGLIVGPLVTDGVSQGNDVSIAVNQSRLGGEVNADKSAQETMAEVQLAQKNMGEGQRQEEFSAQQDFLRRTVDQPLVSPWTQTDPQLREARVPFAQKRTR